MSWEQHRIASEALRDNPLGDPFERPLWVWSPRDVSRSYPTVYVLHAHMRSGPSWFNVDPFERSYPEEIEDLALEAVVVLVDAWTAVGGSQWIDSDGIGLYGTYLRDEVVPFVDTHHPTNGARGLQGKSSGGYGAIVNALERPDLFHAVAAHAPVALFDVAVAHDFPAAARALRDRGGTLEDALRAIDGLGSHADVILVEVGSLAYAFSGGELPFEVETGRLVTEVWERWLEHDPVRLAAIHADAVRALRGVWLDAGRSDEYFLDLGAVALRDALLQAGLGTERMRFELFDGAHRGLSGRYPTSLTYLVETLSITF